MIGAGTHRVQRISAGSNYRNNYEVTFTQTVLPPLGESGLTSYISGWSSWALPLFTLVYVPAGLQIYISEGITPWSAGERGQHLFKQAELDSAELEIKIGH